MRLKSIILATGFAFIFVSYQNCSNVAFSPVPPVVPSATTTALKDFQPALIVRDMTCVICHANIQANVITDFGYNSPWYMSGSGFNTVAYGYSHYVPQTWQSLENVSGQVFVPTSTADTTTVTSVLSSGSQAPTAPVPLTTFLTMNGLVDMFGAWYGGNGAGGNTEPAGNTSFTANVAPPAGAAAVVSKSVLYIGAPTSTEILGLVQNTAPAPWVQVVGSTAMGLGGLSSQPGVNGTNYITNTGPVVCSGKDVVINGTLLLNNAQFFAEHNGCRLYVTGSVFIEGPITYLNSTTTVDATDNLQIASATSIIMGVGLTNTLDTHASATPLQARLLGDNRGLVLRSAASVTDFTGFGTGILNEAQNIGPSLIVDASNYGSLPTGTSYYGINRAKINFQHVLLNAPLIHSRYLGTVSGVIVAESVLFSLGEFSFQYDPVFQNVAAFPALNVDIACVGDAGASCNPAQ